MTQIRTISAWCSHMLPLPAILPVQCYARARNARNHDRDGTNEIDAHSVATAHAEHAARSSPPTRPTLTLCVRLSEWGRVREVEKAGRHGNDELCPGARVLSGRLD